MPDGYRTDLDDGDVRRRLEWVALQLADLRPFWPGVRTVFVGWMRSQFATEGVFGLGRRWAPLTRRYAAWKALHYPGKPILQAEGDLRRAASKPRTVRATATILELAIPWDEEKGEPVRVEWHQEGTLGEVGPKGHEGTMRARPILFGDPLLPGPAEPLERAQDAYLEGILARSGLLEA